MEILYDILLNLDAIIYTFINYLFKVFLLLSKAEIFTEESIAPLVRRIYTLIGVVMLFLLSYSFLKSIVTPDNNKDKESPIKMIFNVVKCIVLLALVPTIFAFAFNVQNSILKYNTIGKLILGTEECVGASCTNSTTINSGGMEMALGVYEAFLFPKNNDPGVMVYNNTITFKEAMESIDANENFFLLDNLSDDVINGTLVYYWGVSSIAGLFVLYMLFSYCLSLGFRVIKLAFYEIMAPVCIIASILPSQKDMLSKWIKATIQTFIEVFLRVAILYFSIYLITAVKQAFAGGLIKNVSGVGEGLAQCLIIMGIVMFMKKAPELISNITGMDKNNMGLGLKEKLAAGGFFTAGAIAGGALIGASRNLVGHGAKGWYNAHNRLKKMRNETIEDEDGNIVKPWENKSRLKRAGTWLSTYGKSFGGGIVGGLFSGVFGGLSGGFHGFDSDSKDFKTMKNAAHKGYEVAGKNAINRANFRAKHSTGDGFISDMINVGVGHVKEFGNKALGMVGIGSIEQLKIENAGMDEIKTTRDAFDDDVKALILKELGKNQEWIKLTGLASKDVHLNELKAKKNALDKARATGADNLVEIEAAYNQELSNLTFQMQDALLRNKKAWEDASDSVKAKLSGVRVRAINYKGAIRNNASLEAVAEAGIHGGDLTDSQDYKLSQIVYYDVAGNKVAAGTPGAIARYEDNDAIDKMGKLIKINKGKNDIKIASAKQNEDANKDKK